MPAPFPKVNTFTLRPKHPKAPEIQSELDRAKMILRRTGRVVFNATVTDGAPGRGFVKVDGRNFTPDQVIERAAQLDLGHA